MEISGGHDVYGYKLVVTVGDDTASAQLLFREALPESILGRDISLEGKGCNTPISYHLTFIDRAVATLQQMRAAIRSSAALLMGATVSDDPASTNMAYLVEPDPTSSTPPAMSLPILLPSIPPILASIERHLLVHEFNSIYLAGIARVDILEPALMISGTQAGRTRQNRGEVVGDALFEVMLVERAVAQCLRDVVTKRPRPWNVARQEMHKNLSNRRMQNSSIA
jgi:hypothetical protein